MLARLKMLKLLPTFVELKSKIYLYEKDELLQKLIVKIFNDVFFEAVCMLNNCFSLLSVILQVLIKRVIKVNHKTDISLIFLADRPRPILYL